MPMAAVPDTRSDRHDKTRFFVNLAAGSFFKRFARFQSSARHHPESHPGHGLFSTAEKNAVELIDQNHS